MKPLLAKLRFDQRGNSLIMTTGMSFISLMIIVMMVTIMGVYIKKEFTQNAADAASLAAAKTLANKYKAELIFRREQALRNFWNEVELAANGQPNLEEGIIEEKIGSPELRQVLKTHKTPSIRQLNNETKYQPFASEFSTENLSEILYFTTSRYREDIFRSAEIFASKNGALSQVRGIFPADGQPKIRIETRKIVKLPIFDEFLPTAKRYISMPSAAKVSSPDLPPLNLKGKTPLTYDSFR